MKAATFTHYGYAIHKVISIHAAREGGDIIFRALGFLLNISIHAAREGGDPEVRIADHIGKISIHAAREGGDSK